MFTLATPEAIDAILTARSSASKITITKFQIGLFEQELPNLAADPTPNVSAIATQANIAAQFTNKYTGGPTKITYSPIGLSRLVLKCYVQPLLQDTFHFDAILLYFSIDGVESVFSLSYYENINPKFNVEMTEGGMQYYFFLTFDIKDIAEKFDFSNLMEMEVTFLEQDDWYGAPDPHKELKDQGVLLNHPNTPNSTPHMMINSREQWYGAQTMAPIFDGVRRDLLLPMVGDFYPIIDQKIPVGYRAKLKEDGSFFLDYLGNELMEKIPHNGYTVLEIDGVPILQNGNEILIDRPLWTYTYQVDAFNYPLRDVDGNLMPI